MTALIECQDIWHNYGEKDVLKGISFSVGKGCIFGLLGKNGAGKSTTINILMGLLRPSRGHCFILGEPGHALSAKSRKNIALLHEGFLSYDFMRVNQLERYFSAFYPRWEKKVFWDLFDKLNVPPTRKLSQLSCGQRSQVILGLLLAQMPELLILDDYSMGLDVGYRHLFIDYLQHYVSTYQATALLTSHVVQELAPILDQLLILKQGEVVVNSSKQEFFDQLHGYQLERNDKLTQVLNNKKITNIESFGKFTRVFGFIQPEKMNGLLHQALGYLPDITPLSLDFEQAFMGVTGKY